MVQWERIFNRIYNFTRMAKDTAAGWKRTTCGKLERRGLNLKICYISYFEITNTYTGLRKEGRKKRWEEFRETRTNGGVCRKKTLPRERFLSHSDLNLMNTFWKYESKKGRKKDRQRDNERRWRKKSTRRIFFVIFTQRRCSDNPRAENRLYRIFFQLFRGQKSRNVCLTYFQAVE